MMKRFPIEITISAGACFYACLLLLLLPLNLVISLYLAAAIHECCHILMLFYFRIPVTGISLGINGAAIRTVPLPPKQELVCAAAGPAGSFLCLLFLRDYPLFALCGLFQGLFNLLPVFPLDGGRILRCLCLCVCPKQAAFICQAVKICTIAAALSASLYLALRLHDCFFILFALYFLLQGGTGRKIPCKGRCF